MDRRHVMPNARCAFAAAAMLVAAAGVLAAERAHGALFVYQAPDGSRLITDRPINLSHYPRYRLIRWSRTIRRFGRAAPRWPAPVPRTGYDGLIRRAAAAHRLDPALVKAVVHVESSFDPYAVSHKGAMGLMQLMPEIARRYGVSNVFDPAQNVLAGTRHLGRLLRRFNHNRHLALAAYNAGEHAVIRHRGVPPYPETRAYVYKVLRLAERYRRHRWY